MGRRWKEKGIAMRGQLNFMPKAPIWHMSLNHVWVECPNCKSYNTAQTSVTVGHGAEMYSVPYNLPECPECGQPFDWSDEAIEAACKYSSDYKKLMQKG